MKTTLRKLNRPTVSHVIDLGFKILIVTVCLGLVCTFPVYAKTYTLKLASVYNSKHPSVANGLKPWIENLKEKSGGRLVIKFFEPNTLAPRNEHMESVRSGIADISYETINNDYQLSAVVTFPFMFKSVEAASLTRWEMLQRYPEMMAEYKGVKIIWGHTSAFYQLHMLEKPVNTLEDLKGERIIVWTADSREYAALLDTAPQQIHYLDNYQALQRNMADGVLCPLAPMRSIKLDEVTKYHTIINFGQAAFWGAMNINAYNKLPADLQKLLDEEAGAKLSGIFGKTLDDGTDSVVAYMKSHDHEFINLPEAEMSRWRDRLKPVYENWISSMEQKGHKNAREMFETALELGKKYQSEIDAR